jgi:hypothetical protein
MAHYRFLLVPIFVLIACGAHGTSTQQSPRQSASFPAASNQTKPLPTTTTSALGEELVQAITSDSPNSTEEVERLLRAGAPVNYGSGSGTPLNLAAYNNDLAVVRLLVSAGAQVNTKDRAPQEESTLELAIRSPNGDPLQLVRFLVEHGADVDAETEGAEADPGSSPQLVAIRRCNPTVLAFLRSRTRKRIVPSPEEICRDATSSNVAEVQRNAIVKLLAEP